MIESWKNILLTIGTVVLALFLFLSWYKYNYSMEVAESFEVNSPEFDQRVLIATQGSEFKDAVVAQVIEHLRQRPVYIKVIDVSLLPGVSAAEWSAVVVLHTWENWKPQLDAKRFLRRVKEPEKVVVLSTSGAGDEKMAGMDAITASSSMEEVPAYAGEIVARLEPLLR